MFRFQRDATRESGRISRKVVENAEPITSQFVERDSLLRVELLEEFLDLLVHVDLRLGGRIDSVDQNDRSAGRRRPSPVSAVCGHSRGKRGEAGRIRFARVGLEDGDLLLLSVIENTEVIAGKRCCSATVHNDVDKHQLTFDPHHWIVLRPSGQRECSGQKRESDPTSPTFFGHLSLPVKAHEPSEYPLFRVQCSRNSERRQKHSLDGGRVESRFRSVRTSDFILFRIDSTAAWVI